MFMMVTVMVMMINIMIKSTITMIIRITINNRKIKVIKMVLHTIMKF